jgi:MinD superfamily P-loop ATPase
MAYEILIASGKGGAGKTSVSASLAKYLGEKAMVADYDVDAANLSILTANEIIHKQDYNSGYIAEINQKVCINCGRCYDVCRFDAVVKDKNSYKIDQYSCEGCAYCYDVCLANAIEVKSKRVGEWYQELTRFNSILFSARLEPGSDNSGKLVTSLKEKAHEKAMADGIKFIISDAPPGIGCPIISSISGIDMLLIVIELSKTGVKDAIRLINLAIRFRVKIYCILNKVGMTDNLNEVEQELKSVLEKEKIEIIGKIPYQREFISLLQEKKSPLETEDESIIENFENIFSKILDLR